MGQIPIGNITSFMDIVVNMNDASDGLIAIGMLTLVFAVLLYRNYRAEGKIFEALGSSLYITLLISALFWWIGLIPLDWTVLLIAATSIYAGSKYFLA